MTRDMRQIRLYRWTEGKLITDTNQFRNVTSKYMSGGHKTFNDVTTRVMSSQQVS